jgi:cyclophilin family peptidyl-prolyl cis-trans isomerase
MIKRLFFSLLLFSAFQTFTFCQDKETIVVIETSMGDIKIRLYDDTPVHKENFLKLVNDGYYNGTLFHRVINEFMIQGGDPDSRDAAPSKQLGAGGPTYTLTAEIIYPKYFHKKGALAAARQGDATNPERKSSGSQFYLVHGKAYTNEELAQLENMQTEKNKQKIMMKYAEPFNQQLAQFRQAGDREGFNALVEKISAEAMPLIDAVEPFVMPEEHRKAYTTIGGAPHLDDDYTVFGEVIEGLDVIDKIANVETGRSDRPLKDIVMSVKVIK